MNVLYSFRRCPYAIRARMALKYSGISVVIYEVSLKDKPTCLLKISPKGQVPVLVTKGVVIDESMAIILYALSEHDPDGWLGKDDRIRAQMSELVLMNDTHFKKNLDAYKYFDINDETSLSNCRANGEAFLKLLENRLNESEYLFGDKMSYVDISIFPFVRQYAHVDLPWFSQAPYPKVQKWLAHWLASTLFNEVMVKGLKEL